MALIDELLEHLSLTVKRDDLTKKILLLTCMSAYSPDPLNVFLKGESSIGKTHNAVECVKYFPKKDVWKLGALSPTALAHDYGVLEDENNREIVRDEDEKGKEEIKEVVKEEGSPVVPAHAKPVVESVKV